MNEQMIHRMQTPFKIIRKGNEQFLLKPDGSLVKIWNPAFTPEHIIKYPNGLVHTDIAAAHPAWSWGDFIWWKKKEEEKQKINTPMTDDQIEGIIKRPIVFPLFEDQKGYYPADFQQLVNSLRRYRIATRNRYQLPSFDCGDFAFAGMGVWHLELVLARMACFIVWVEYPKGGEMYAHALLGACDGAEFKLIEPQNYLVFSLPGDYTILVLFG